MKKSFIAKVLHEEMVDTREYRYLVRTKNSLSDRWRIIIRLPISDLDTTAAIDGWEEVWSEK